MLGFSYVKSLAASLGVGLLLCALAPASQPALENLGQPCRAFNVLAGRDVIDADVAATPTIGTYR